MSTFNGFTERRERLENPLAHHRKSLLKAQKPSIKKLEEQGFIIWFVRKLSNDIRLAVLKHQSDPNNVAAVYHDGEIDYAPKLNLRQE